MPQISIPIIDQLVHPSFALITRVAVSGTPTLTGNGSLTPPQGPLALTYGIGFSAFTVPAAWGRKLGNPNVFNPPFLQFSVTYTDLSGHVFVKQIEWISVDGTYYWWDDPLPTALQYHVEPGWVLIPFWLQT